MTFIRLCKYVLCVVCACVHLFFFLDHFYVSNILKVVFDFRRLGERTAAFWEGVTVKKNINMFLAQMNMYISF